MTNTYFGRRTIVTCNGLTFDSDALEIRFEVPFDDDSKPNETKIEIFNLSQDSIAKLTRGSTLTLQAGYKGDIGVIAAGKITRVLTKKERVDKITTIFVLEGVDYSKVKVTSGSADAPQKYTTGKKKGQNKKQAMKISFKAGTDAKTIITRLLGVLGIKPQIVQLPRNKTYAKGYTVSGLILNNLEEVVRSAGAVMYFRRGKLVIRDILHGDDERFTLNENTGLIGNPEQFEEEGVRGYRGRCLLQHRITTASIISVQSATAKGTYRIIKGKHSSNGTDHWTEWEAV